MVRNWKTLPAVALLMSIASAPALATVTLSFSPQNSFIGSVGGTTNVEIRADLTEAVLGWGLDVNVGNPGVADLIGFTVGPLWDPALATFDGDLLAGLSLGLTDVGPATGVLLATLTFQAFGLGVTPISLSLNDEDEGFPRGAGNTGLADVVFGAGTITVPEPSTLVLVALGGWIAIRRRG